MATQTEHSYATQSGKRVRLVVWSGDMRLEVFLDAPQAQNLAAQLRQAVTAAVGHAEAVEKAGNF